MLWAIIAGLCVAFYIFISSNIAYLGIESKFLLGAGKLLITIPIIAVYSCVKKESFFHIFREVKDKKSGKIRWNIVIMLFMMEVFTFVLVAC